GGGEFICRVRSAIDGTAASGTARLVGTARRQARWPALHPDDKCRAPSIACVSLPIIGDHSRGARDSPRNHRAEMLQSRPVEPDPTSIGVGKSSTPACVFLFISLLFAGRDNPSPPVRS